MQYLDINALSELLSGYSNPNIVINSNFKINQRKKVSYTGNGYTVDLWKLTADSTYGTVTPKDKYIELSYNNNSSTTKRVVFGQPIEDVNTYSERTLTFSTYYKTNYKIKFGIFAGNTYSYTELKDDNQWHYAHITYTIPEDAMLLKVEFCANQIPANSNYVLDIKWVKGEVGSIATEYIPPDPATELLRCKRFYQFISMTIIASSYLTNENKLSFRMYVPNMYTKKTPSCNIIGHAMLPDESIDNTFGIIKNGNAASAWSSYKVKSMEYYWAEGHDFISVIAIMDSSITVEDRNWVIYFGNNAGIEVFVDIDV